MVDVDLSGANDSGFDPYLTVYASDGSVLAENNNISDVSYDARIAALILPQTGDYFIRAGQPGYTTPYQLRLTTRRATPTVMGSSRRRRRARPLPCRCSGPRSQPSASIPRPS